MFHYKQFIVVQYYLRMSMRKQLRCKYHDRRIIDDIYLPSIYCLRYAGCKK